MTLDGKSNGSNDDGESKKYSDEYETDLDEQRGLWVLFIVFMVGFFIGIWIRGMYCNV